MQNGWENFFRGKRVTLMGLGLLGRGIGDAAFLARCGAKILITDKKSATELAPSIQKLKKFSNIRFALGGHDMKDFSNADMILKAAGVSLNSPYIKEARKHKVPVYMSTALFVKLLPPGATVIGITGTRGKTTTSFMIYEIIKRSMKHEARIKDKKRTTVFLGGNIQGVSTLAMLPKIKSGDFVVLELDSWQLQGFGDLKISPHIAVFTNFFPDHMNYYGDSMARYFVDKSNIFKYQYTNLLKYQDTLVVGEQAIPFMKKWEPKHAKRAVMARTGDVSKNWKLKIPGEHNRQNIVCAIAAADALCVPRTVSKKAIEDFRGVPGRLEMVREVHGVKIYNDTTATTPDATIAALRALGEATKQKSNEAKKQRSKKARKQSIILIMGGADKGLDMSALVREIPKYCKAVILLSGTGSKKFSIFNFQFSNNLQIQNSKFTTHHSLRYIVVKNLTDALAHALESAHRGDIILFSPAFASFGMFKNEYDRGGQFNRLVRRLKR